MIESINEEILHLKERLREYNKLETLRKTKAEELSKKISQRRELKTILDKERSDVEKLEGLSIATIFSTLLGKRYEKLEDEKEEYLLAKLKYEDSEDQINKLEEELEAIDKYLIEYGDIKSKYARLIIEKEELIIKEAGSLGIKLKDLILNIDELKIDLKEIREAVAAGEKSLRSLEEVREKLQSAKNWGTWDILGGGLISNIGKHSAIDEANKIAVDVQEDLRSFTKELADVNEFTDIQVNLSSFASFADFFFDGIFADWFVQTKINDSLDNVNSTMYKIDEIIINLKQNQIRLEKDIDKNKEEVNEILGA